MQRLQVSLTDPQVEWLNAWAKSKHISPSEVLRQYLFDLMEAHPAPMATIEVYMQPKFSPKMRAAKEPPYDPETMDLYVIPYFLGNATRSEEDWVPPAGSCMFLGYTHVANGTQLDGQFGGQTATWQGDRRSGHYVLDERPWEPVPPGRLRRDGDE
jgi:hypothetical protein